MNIEDFLSRPNAVVQVRRDDTGEVVLVHPAFVTRLPEPGRVRIDVPGKEGEGTLVEDGDGQT